MKNAREARHKSLSLRPETSAESVRQGIGKESFCACFTRTKKAARHA
ncbi:hypothetical protein [Sphingopyxis sp. GW247-27LB]|nr:hypothetical protein [Sphingopyxis sp. GW247-27LB]